MLHGLLYLLYRLYLAGLLYRVKRGCSICRRISRWLLDILLRAACVVQGLARLLHL